MHISFAGCCRMQVSPFAGCRYPLLPDAAGCEPPPMPDAAGCKEKLCRMLVESLFVDFTISSVVWFPISTQSPGDSTTQNIKSCFIVFYDHESMQTMCSQTTCAIALFLRGPISTVKSLYMGNTIMGQRRDMCPSQCGGAHGRGRL